MAKTVADFLLERLTMWGVRRIYGYPGDGINGLLAALNRAGDRFEFVQARHEEMAAFMACAHAKVSGEVGVCLATGRILGIRYPMEVNLIGDSAETLRALIPLLERKADRSWQEQIAGEVGALRKLIETRAHNSADPINPQRVFFELSAQLPDRAILTSDSGSSANWFARDVRIREGMMASLSGTLATMGPGVPYAIAARFAHPDRPVIALVGDGTMQMNGKRGLVTIAKYWERWSDPRLIVLVLHNNDLNQVTWEQRAMEGDPRYEASQQLPDFPYARYAELIGLTGIRVDDPDRLREAWEQAFAATRPVVSEAITDPEVPPLPPQHHDRAGQGADLCTGARRPECRADRQAGRQGQARRVSARPMNATHTTAAAAEMSVRGLSVDAYTVPTDAPEADGTFAWDATTIVVVHVEAGGERGIGYTYADLATARLIDEHLAGVVHGADALAPQRAWWAMSDAVRNLGRPGISAMAISAVDIALWDLKARLLELPLATLLGAVHEQVPVYGSGGFTSYSIDRLQRQLAAWVQAGIPRVKMKIGSHPQDDLERVVAAREAIGEDAALFVDANGAYARKQALAQAERFYQRAAVSWFEEPVSSEDLEGLRLLRDRGPAGMEIAAGEYGYEPAYFQRMLAAGAVDVAQADATRCGGVTGLLAVAALCQAHQIALSAHCAPQLHAHACCAIGPLRHLEYFHDHARIEQLLFDGALAPRDGALRPDPDRPGLGIELRARDAAAFAP
jgi:L-alanine-DL-glutamate epimerase-like enolase superfamily enzyme